MISYIKGIAIKVPDYLMPLFEPFDEKGKPKTIEFCDPRLSKRSLLFGYPNNTRCRLLDDGDYEIIIPLETKTKEGFLIFSDIESFYLSPKELETLLKRLVSRTKKEHSRIFNHKH